MKFVKFEGELPDVKRRNNKSLIRYFDDFMVANIKVAKVTLDEGDYKNVVVARNTLSRAAKRHGYPITVRRVKDEIFMIRRDI